jgi:hypothetical protein
MAEGTTTVSQAYNFGPVSTQGASLAYVVICTEGTGAQAGTWPSPLAVSNAVSAVAPATWCSLPIVDIRVEHQTDKIYLCEAVYARQQAREQIGEATGGCVLDFDTTGGTQHITVSKATTSYVPGGGTVRDVKGVIGDDGQRVHGVDIGFAVYRFSEEWLFPDANPPGTPAAGIAAATCNSTYRAILKALTYTTNAATFRGFAAGEVLFEGATGRRVKGGYFSVTFKFAVSPNASSITVGDITVSAKGGWQYLDVRMKDSSNADRVVQIPAQANVHTVYGSGDFSTLAIGTGAI